MPVRNKVKFIISLFFVALSSSNINGQSDKIIISFHSSYKTTSITCVETFVAWRSEEINFEYNTSLQEWVCAGHLVMKRMQSLRSYKRAVKEQAIQNKTCNQPIDKGVLNSLLQKFQSVGDSTSEHLKFKKQILITLIYICNGRTIIYYNNFYKRDTWRIQGSDEIIYNPKINSCLIDILPNDFMGKQFLQE